MAVVPADEFGRTHDAGKVFPRNAELAIVRRTDGKDHGVVQLKQVRDRHVLADSHIADEIDACAVRHFVVTLADRFQRLVVRGDAEADQPIRNGIAIDDVDPSLLAIRLFERLRGVEARRPRSDHGEVAL